MPGSIKHADELLPYRTVREIFAGRRTVVHALAPADTVERALLVMAQNDIGLVVVLDNDRMVGVLSERDLLRRAHPTETAAVFRQLPVSELMTRDVATVTPDERVARCVELMEQRGARHLPVVDGGRVVAVLSVRDLLREALKHHSRLLAEVEQERLAAFQPIG
jgi:CBS domain-containing protein